MPLQHKADEAELADKLKDMLGKVNYMLVDVKALSIKYRDWRFVASLLEACIGLLNLCRLTLKELLDHLGDQSTFTED